MAQIIDGKTLSQKIKDEIKVDVAQIVASGRIAPSLAVVLVGNNPASEIYVANKIKACEYTGIISRTIRLPESTSEKELLTIIDELNRDKNVNGILVQLPLPKQIDENKVLQAIDVKKDADGFTPESAGRLFSGAEGLLPCTPAGIIELIKSTGTPIAGKHAVVVGRSNIVGKPAAILLLRENATVTVAHSKTENLAALCSTADILVAAIGKKEFIRGNFIKTGATVIDVGVNRFEGKLYGDVCFAEAQHAAYITPVPGGVGPMTIAMLLKNTLKAYKLQNP